MTAELHADQAHPQSWYAAALSSEVEAGAAEDLAEEIKTRMEAAASLRVPLKVDFGLGSNWDEAH